MIDEYGSWQILHGFDIAVTYLLCSLSIYRVARTSEPSVAALHSCCRSIQAYLVVDRKVVDEVPFEDIPFILMAAFSCTIFVTLKDVLIFMFS